jgi:hypothetical protein
MAKRLLFVAMILAAVLVVAAPALAFNGARADYTPSNACKMCHTDTPSIPQVYNGWAETKHADANADGQSTRLPYGSVCAGCHTSNYAPGKVVPTPTATASAGATPGAVTWIGTNVDPGDPQSQKDQDSGNFAASELDVGCSSCHQSQTAAHAVGQANPANMANPDICGQCHTRYSYTVDTYTVAPVPYVKVTTPLPGTPITPNPAPTSLIQPQMAIGFEPMGDAAGGWQPPALTTNLNIPEPDWTPTPNPSATTAGFGRLQTYWTSLDGEVYPWAQTAHDGNAQQYAEWYGPADKHRFALENLKKVMGPNPPAECVECHSADYIIAPEDAKPTGEQARYGISCVGCHTPHEKGTAEGVWDENFTPQLRYDDAATLCTSCHNAELDGKVAKPGSTVHHPMKEMMAGVGAISVMQGSPSVHKGKCVQCHMPPTTYSRGSVQLGANHTFKIIEPETAVDVKPIPVATTTPTPGASPVVTMATMPFSACSTCHSRPGDQAATWLQHTIDDRQVAMHSWNDQVTAALTKAAKRLGFKSTAAANTAINKKPMKTWSKGQMSFQKAFTNQSYVVAEGSWGVHNWDYARTVILTALSQANSAKK